MAAHLAACRALALQTNARVAQHARRGLLAANGQCLKWRGCGAVHTGFQTRRHRLFSRLKWARGRSQILVC